MPTHRDLVLPGQPQGVPALGNPREALAQMKDLEDVEQRVFVEIQTITAAINQLAALITLHSKNTPFIAEKINACCAALGLPPLEGQEIVVQGGKVIGTAAELDLEEAAEGGTVEGEDRFGD